MKELIFNSYLQNLSILHQHSISLDPMMFEAQETIVDSVEAKFSSDLPKLDTGKWKMSFLVSELHHEGLDAMTLAMDIQVCHYDAIVCRVGHWEEEYSIG